MAEIRNEIRAIRQDQEELRYMLDDSEGHFADFVDRVARLSAFDQVWKESIEVKVQNQHSVKVNPDEIFSVKESTVAKPQLSDAFFQCQYQYACKDEEIQCLILGGPARS